MGILIDPRDTLIQAHRPTMAVPAFSPIPQINQGSTRYLMASDGLYLDSKTHWGHLTVKLWDSPVKTPYGNIEQHITFNGGLLPREILKEMALEAVKASPLEFAGMVTWSETKGYKFIVCEPINSGVGHINYKIPHMEPDESIVIDVHSHGNSGAFFSAQDNLDDQGGVRICMVLGRCGAIHNIRTKARVVIEGHFLPLKMGAFIQSNRGTS